MQNISKFEKDKLLQLLECNEDELRRLKDQSNYILQESDNTYESLLKILQQGLNIREATLSGILLGQELGYQNAKIEIEKEIKEKLYQAFKNN